MRVRVERVTGMPHGAETLVDDRPDDFILWVREDLISADGAKALEGVLAVNAEFWQRPAKNSEDDQTD
jgi:hypothetical protein